MSTYESDSLSVEYPPVILFGALEEKSETKQTLPQRGPTPQGEMDTIF